MIPAEPPEEPPTLEELAPLEEAAEDHDRRRLLLRLAALLIIGLGLVGSLTAFALRLTTRRQVVQHTITASVQADRIVRSRIERAVEVLYGMASLWEVDDTAMNEARFDAHAARAFDRHPYLYALQYAERWSDPAAYARETGAAILAFPARRAAEAEAATCGERLPIRYVSLSPEPRREADGEGGDADAGGPNPRRTMQHHDLFSERSRRLEALLALTGAGPHASPPFHLAESPEEDRLAIALYLPIRGPSHAIEGPTDATFESCGGEVEDAGASPARRKEVDPAAGLLVAIFRVDDLLGNLDLSGVSDRCNGKDCFRLTVDDVGPDGAVTAVFSSGGPAPRELPAAWGERQPFGFGHRQWRVTVGPTVELAIDPSVATGVGSAGLIVLGILALLLVLWERVQRAERRAKRAYELGAYRIEKKLGEGGMGMVYLARHEMLRRRTAVKLIRSQDAKSIARFEQEVRASSGLRHPHTVAIYDYGRTTGGVFYYAMEYIDGFNLFDVLVQDGPLPPGRVAHLMAQAAEAIAEAHDVGIVHRDLKPANLMITRLAGVPDFVKVVDFGLAQARGEQSDGVAGTPLYVSPEAIALEPVGPPADVYGLGCTAYHLLTGRPPFVAETAEEVYAMHRNKAPLPPSRRVWVPERLERLVLSCLAKEGHGRPTALALADAFREVAVDAGWTRADSEAWWQGRGPKTSLPAPSSGPSELTVDLRSRRTRTRG
jgi:tRNA A-37 threonylcarbamoyl transferase component Bud32/CHASE1-domain containing sensor protein